MDVQLVFGVSVVFGLIAWSVVAALYLWPRLKDRARTEALQPLLVLHVFRFIGLSFLVPGVVAPDLPAAFAREAGYGDLLAAVLALGALAGLRRRWGIAAVWAFNLWGTFDLLNALFQANASGLTPGMFGASFFIPTAIVPLLLVSHAMVFRILLRPDPAIAPAPAGKGRAELRPR